MTVTQEAKQGGSVTTVIYEIPEYRMDAFMAIVLRANRKAAKLGVAPFVVTEQGVEAMVAVTARIEGTVSRSIVTVAEAAERQRGASLQLSPVNVITVTVQGDAPIVAGWAFAATIDHADTGNVVTQVPGSDLAEVSPLVSVAEWVKASAACDHCQLVRNRMKTYLLHEVATSALKQVGSTCIADFLGGNTAAQMAQLAELWSIIELGAGSDSDHEYGAGGIAGWVRADVLAQTAAVVRELGFLGKAKAGEQGRTPTVAHVTDALCWTKPTKAQPERPFPTIAADWDTAEAVMAWIEGLNPQPSEDYLWNLTSAVARPVTVHKMMGLVVSAVSAYDREMGYQARKAAEDAVPEVKVPVNGERITITALVLSARLQETDYGTVKKLLLQVAHENGAYKLWGNAASSIWEAEAGDTVTFTAKVSRSDKDEAFGFWSRPTKASIAPKGW